MQSIHSIITNKFPLKSSLYHLTNKRVKLINTRILNKRYYIEGNAQMTHILYYTFVPLLDRTYTLAATDKGLAYVSPDDQDLTALAYYFKDYDPIEASGNHSDQEDWLQQAARQLDEYIQGQREIFTVPLDLSHGTAFQQAVWQSLLQVPYGHTTTYGDISQRIGNPKAVRAAGGAIGKNPISIIVPCHRIVGKDGNLTGYSGGLDIKIKLLTIENIQLL